MKRQYAAIIAGIAFFVLGGWPLTSQAQAITILSPSPNSVVQPGASVPIQVQVDSSLLPAELDIGSNEHFKVLVAKTLTGGPDYSGSIDIPVDVSGPLVLSFALIRPESQGGGLVSGDATAEITLNVIPDETPLSLDVDSTFTLSYIGSGTRTSRDWPTRDDLSVSGLYANNIYRDLTLPMLGTTYASSNTAVATVDASGAIQATGVGYAILTIENRGVRAYSVVEVDGPNRTEPPPIDVTSQLAIGAGGFQFDPVEEVFVQQLTIRNISDAPIPFPLTVVLDGVPKNVSLSNSPGHTKVAEPLGRPIARGLTADAPGPVLAPGHSATTTLKFLNQLGMPISYTVKVYVGSRQFL